ncbi:MAG: YccF domain-containing protein [Bacteroidales bacterium]|nr:YccF domain-containing protein [Bacteroidales bacterium]
MKFLGNLVWLVLGGLLVSIIYILSGLVLCITVVGIPFGLQLIKFGRYAFWPFGHEVVNRSGEPGCLSIVMNLVWILLGWWEVAIVHLVFGLLFCITIVGVPFGIQHFKLALASVFPFGKEIV